MTSDPTTTPAGGTVTAERPVEAPSAQTPWATIVWDDPVNTMGYVVHVFTQYFGYPQEKSERLMLTVHNEGNGGFAGMLLGSTSRSLLHSVECPVMIVHR